MHKPIYLDNMASTPMDPAVLAVMCECLTTYGNPSSHHHAYGSQANQLIEAARQQVADGIHANSNEIYWTSGATESINLAIKGASLFYHRKGKHILTLETEHKAVLKSCASLEDQGFTVTYLKTESTGLVDLEKFKAALRPDTVLASVAWVNNETGVIQDIAEIAKITQQKGALLHIDGAQALGKISINLRENPIDLLSLSAHKVYGPQGIGSLYIRGNPRLHLIPQMQGGGQERGLRSGSLATHQIVGMGKAFELAHEKWIEDRSHIESLSRQLWKGLSTLQGIELNGSPDQRVPHCLNLSIAGTRSETLMMSLNELALSSGSACHSAYSTPSHVLTGMGLNADRALSALRISLGRFTTADEIEKSLQLIKQKVQFLREISPIWNYSL